MHGIDAQRKLQSSNVVIIGLSGLGAEVAKNIILAGVGTVTLCDPEPPTSYDLGGNYCLSEDCVGHDAGRAILSATKLDGLNPNTTVRVAHQVSSINNEAELTALVQADATSCLVVTLPLPISTVLVLNDLCRARGVPFIYSQVNGVFGHVFCDFGQSFIVYDKDGEEPVTSQVKEILPTNPATVNVDASIGMHGLESGDWVKIERVKGADGSIIRSTQEYEVEVTNEYSFRMLGCDLSNCEEAATQGYVKQVKRSSKISFWPLRKMLRHPEESYDNVTDEGKADRPPLLHLAFRALAAYQDRHGNRLPNPGHRKQVKEVVDLAHALDRDGIMQAVPDAKRIVANFASGSRAILSPMCAIFGGIVGQEILKAITGKQMPIKGFAFFDSEECLPPRIPDEIQLRPTLRSRSDSQRAVFGEIAQTNIEQQRFLLAGAGAIGSEVLKNWAMMGLGSSPDSGCVHIVDPDRVTKSNLSRQLLFRDNDIGQFKTETAATAARAINSSMNIAVYNDLLCDFPYFFSNLSGVCTALDNVEGREYLDKKCILYGLPMFDGGTCGTKGSCTSSVPHLTENYAASKDPDLAQQEISSCTLKNFPCEIEHTLQWAKEFFTQSFDSDIRNAKAFIFDPDGYLQRLGNQTPRVRMEKVKALQKVLVDERPYTFTDCLVWARQRFEEMYRHDIEQLLYNFPPDHVTQFGVPFWRGSRRRPKPLNFDPSAKCEDTNLRNHYGFIFGTAKLRADAFGLTSNTDESYVLSVLNNVIIPPFEPKEGVEIDTGNETNFSIGGAGSREKSTCDYMHGFFDKDEYNDLINSLPRRKELVDIRLLPVPLDLDNDLHLNVVTTCSNLRALNYDIPTQHLQESKSICSPIMPAISTTTALIGGLICLEIYKVCGTPQQKLRIKDLKNTFVNQALPLMTMSEPVRPPTRTIQMQGKQRDVTDWDLIDLCLQNATLKQMLKHFQKHLAFVVNVISSDDAIIYDKYNASLNGTARPQRLKIPVTELYLNATKQDFFPDCKEFLELHVDGFDAETGEEVDLPRLRYYFR